MSRHFESVDDRFGSEVYTLTLDEIDKHVANMREVGLDYPDLAEDFTFTPDGHEYGILRYVSDDPELDGDTAFIERNSLTISARLVSN